MGFAEFVRAVDGDPLADAILAADMDLLANVSEKLERLLKEYLVVGGMPEVVSAFAETRDSSKPEGFSSKSSRLTNPILANMHPPASSSA